MDVRKLSALYGLKWNPFLEGIPIQALCKSPRIDHFAWRVEDLVMHGGFALVTGDVGAGKTVSVRAAVAGLDPTRHQIIYIANPAFGTRGLYVTIVRSLGAEPRYLKAELMAQAADLLAAETAERHRRVVLVVDEAHLLAPAQLEELRLLTLCRVPDYAALDSICAGQRHLPDRIVRHNPGVARDVRTSQLTDRSHALVGWRGPRSAVGGIDAQVGLGGRADGGTTKHPLAAARRRPLHPIVGTDLPHAAGIMPCRLARLPL
jgi:type II secretory pathway predicted ATPase ExeA